MWKKMKEKEWIGGWLLRQPPMNRIAKNGDKGDKMPSKPHKYWKKITILGGKKKEVIFKEEVKNSKYGRKTQDIVLKKNKKRLKK